MADPVVIEEAVKLFSSGVNGFDYQEQLEHFSKAFLFQHRTLQQSMWRVIFKFIGRYENAPYDLRNEQAVITCKRITSAMRPEMGFGWDVTSNLPTI